MIRFRIRELLSDKQFEEDRVVTVTEMAEATGISRVTLSKMLNHRGYVTGSDTLDKLCRYFACRLEKLAEYIPDEKLSPIGSPEALTRVAKKVVGDRTKRPEVTSMGKGK